MRKKTPESPKSNEEEIKLRYEIFADRFKKFLRAYKELVESTNSEQTIGAYNKNRYAQIQPDDPLLNNLKAQDSAHATVVAFLITEFFKEGKVTPYLENLLKNMSAHQGIAPLVIADDGRIMVKYITEAERHTGARIVVPIKVDDAFAIETPYELLNKEIRNLANAAIGLASHRANVDNTPFKEEDLTVPEIKNLALAPEWEMEEWK